jgi:hypothetical protein
MRILGFLAVAASCSCLLACSGDVVCEGQGCGTGGSGGGTGGTGGSGGAGAAGGFGGSGGSGGGNPMDPYFNANVAPILDAMCASCHAFPDEFNAPDFLGDGPDAYYDMLVSDLDLVNAAAGTSRLLTRGLHTGPYWEPEQEAIVRTWLELEADQRFGGVIEGPTGEELLEQLVACMTLDDWLATGMGTAAVQTTLTGQTCQDCHQSGTGGNYMGDQSAFNSMKDPLVIGALVRALPANGPNGAQTAELHQSCRWNDKASDSGAHPKYVFTSQQPKVDTWFQITMETCFGVAADETCPQ